MAEAKPDYEAIEEQLYQAQKYGDETVRMDVATVRAMIDRTFELAAALGPFAYVGENGLVTSPNFAAYEHAAKVLGES